MKIVRKLPGFHPGNGSAGVGSAAAIKLFGAGDIAAAIEVTEATEAGEVTGAAAGAAAVGRRLAVDTGAALWDEAAPRTGATVTAAPLPEPAPLLAGLGEDPLLEAAPLPECAAPPEGWVIELLSRVGFGDDFPPDIAPLLGAVPPVAVLGAADDSAPEVTPVLTPFVGAPDSLFAAEEADASPVSA